VKSEILVEDRIYAALLQKSQDPQQLGQALAIEVATLGTALQSLAAQGRVCNVGSPKYPIWTARIGDQTSEAELEREILRLISERPMNVEALACATGARLTRVDRAVCAIRARPELAARVVDLGGGVVPDCWFLEPGSADDPTRPLTPDDDDHDDDGS
jgi:predicted Rossmann fold nucleotide-binding protein DprA/Smf involved in DNA uptake